MPDGEVRTRGNARGGVEWEGRSGIGGEEGVSASELHCIPSVPSLHHPVSTVQGWEDRGSRGNGKEEEKRREDTSVGMEKHSSQQSLSCLLPNIHTPHLVLLESKCLELL